MILIDVDDNPNCRGVPQMSYAETDPAKRVVRIRIDREGHPVACWVVGVEEKGRWCPVYSQKVVDSGAGHAFVVYGGRWGIRFQTTDPKTSPWDLKNPEQWGEAYLLLGSEEDLELA